MVEVISESEMVIQTELVFKEFGKSVSAQKNYFILDIAQRIALDLGGNGPISIDEVRGEMKRRKIDFESGNWLGSVFKGDKWRPYGFKVATHEGAHGRIVRTWVRK